MQGAESALFPVIPCNGTLARFFHKLPVNDVIDVILEKTLFIVYDVANCLSHFTFITSEELTNIFQTICSFFPIKNTPLNVFVNLSVSFLLKK